MRNLSIMAHFFARKHGIKVKIANVQTAATDGQTILIPRSWAVSEEPWAEDLLHGVLCHEGAGHAVHTDMALWTAAIDAHPKGKMVYKNLMNVLEDVRIENRIIERRPEFKRLLTNLVEIVHREKDFFGLKAYKGLDTESGFAPQIGNGINQLIGGMLACGRAYHIPGQEMLQNEGASEFGKECRTLFGDGLWDACLDALSRAAQAQATEEMIAITDELWAKLPVPEDEQQSGKGKKRNQSGSGEGEGEAKEVTSGSSGTDAFDIPQEVLEQLQKDIETDVVSITVEITEAVNQVMQEITREAQNHEMTEEKAEYTASEITDRDSLAIANKLHMMSEEMREYFQSMTIRRRKVSDSGRKLSAKHLYRTRLDDARIFRTIEQHQEDGAAVMLLCDHSGSMSSSLSDMVSRKCAVDGAMLGLARIMDELEVNFSIMEYNYSYVVTHDFGQYFQGNLNACRPGGGTRTGSAAVEAVIRLSAQPQKRKLLVILTDGDSYDEELLTSVILEAQGMGIVVVNAFIGSECYSSERLAKNMNIPYSVCNDSSKVAKYLLSQLQATLGF